jgi:predicted metalloprotease with PDZ domain
MRSRAANLLYSIGLQVDPTGKISQVQWDSPAFKAGLTTAVTITGVNGEAFSADKLRAAAGMSKNKPVELLYRQGDTFKTIKLDYNGGHKYPNLERITGKPDLISGIYAAR